MSTVGLLTEKLDRMGYLLEDIEDSGKFWGSRKRTGEGIFIKLYDTRDCGTAMQCFSREMEIYSKLFRSRDSGSGATFGGPIREEDGEIFARPYHFFMIGKMAGVFVSRFYDGQSLCQRMLGYKKDLSDIDTRIADMISVLKAFERLHEEGIVYVDVKPEDLLVNAFPRDRFSSMRLVDFDYSRRAGESMESGIYATAGYISKDFDHTLNVQAFAPATDISALGFLFLDMASGYDQSMHLKYKNEGECRVRRKGTGMVVCDIEADMRGPGPSQNLLETIRPHEKDKREVGLLDSWREQFWALVTDPKQRAKADRLHDVVKRMLERERWNRYRQVDEIIGDLMPLVA